MLSCNRATVSARDLASSSSRWAFRSLYSCKRRVAAFAIRSCANSNERSPGNAPLGAGTGVKTRAATRFSSTAFTLSLPSSTPSVNSSSVCTVLRPAEVTSLSMRWKQISVFPPSSRASFAKASSKYTVTMLRASPSAASVTSLISFDLFSVSAAHHWFITSCSEAACTRSPPSS